MGWLFLMVVATVTLVRGQETCLSGDDDPYLLFGTKTSYLFANKDLPNKRVHDIPGCQPIALWLLNRHGSQNPEVDEVLNLQRLRDLKDNILDNQRKGNYRNFNERICSADINLLQDWQWNPRHNLTFAGNLTSDGYLATQTLAQTWRSKFPGLLTDNQHDYMVKFANDPLSSTTFRAFTEGLFRAQAEGLDIPKENDERLLRPYKYCPSWSRNVGENNDTMAHRFSFEAKREFSEMITNISHRLAFNWDLDRDTIHRMYQMCRYNKAWDVVHISPWCAVFSKEDLKRLEYAEDLETYYKYGYGSLVNQKLGCSPIKDMINFFTKHAENEPPQQPRALIQFTEAPLILLTLTALMAHRDQLPLTADNYHSNAMQRRQWRTSNMAPYNANLAAALYKCNPNGNFQVNDQYQVLFLENEKPMNLEGCSVGLCDWSHVKNVFGDIAKRCDMQFCNGAASINGVVGFSVTLIAFLARFVV